MKKILMCVAMVAMLAACSKGDGEDGSIMSPMSDPDDVCSAMDDIYFMQYCYANFDINGDAKVSKQEAATVTSMRIDNYGVKSIRGIEYFVNLEDIDGESLDIAVADLRANTKLQKVNFSGCKDLVEVRLPNGVTLIGKSAFSGCSSLTSITIPNSVTLIVDFAFCYCNSLTSIAIPNSVTLIGMYAFSDCESLTSITIPNSVTSIGGGAFSVCSSLAKFDGKFSSQDGRCLIVDGEMVAFAPYGLTTYAIPEGVTSIGLGAFSGCRSLTSITIPNSVTLIGPDAFFCCTSLTSIMIPEGVTSIGNYAFNGCSSLTSITIPNSVTLIGGGAFSLCSSLAKIAGKFSSRDGRCLIVDGEMVAFAPYGLTTYAIPEGVTSIGKSAFSYCSSLTSITIPNSVTLIGLNAFFGCSSLTSITIPESVTSIERNSFEYCSSLMNVYCKPTTPPSGGDEMFYRNLSGRKIYVPHASVDAYKQAEYWRGYADDIVGYDF